MHLFFFPPHAFFQGFFVHYTLDTVLNNVEGKQLVAESVYLLGTMLLLLDRKIPGPVRERMLVAVFRYKGPAEAPLIDEVRKLRSNRKRKFFWLVFDV